MIIVRDAARNQVDKLVMQDAVSKDSFIRVGVEGGGAVSVDACSSPRPHATRSRIASARYAI